MPGMSSGRLARIASLGRRNNPDADVSCVRERLTLTTMLSPETKTATALSGASKNREGGADARICAHHLTGDPAIVRLLVGSPLDRWFCVPTFLRVCP